MSLEAEDDDAQVMHHKAYALRAYLMYLVGTSIFMDNSAYHANMVYLRYFVDFKLIQEYNWGRLFNLPILQVS